MKEALRRWVGEMKNRAERKSVDEIIRILRRELPQLSERYGVRSLGIFGSYLRGGREDGATWIY